MTLCRVCEPSKVISLSLDFNCLGGDDLGAGSSDIIQINNIIAPTFTQPEVLPSSSSPESTLRFFDLGGGGSDRLKGEPQGIATLRNSYRMEENLELRLREVQQ